MRDPSRFEFSRRHERILREAIVDQNSPGTVLYDVEAFLSFIGQQGIPLTGMRQLRRRLLPEINARLTRPLQHGLTKPLQKSYPHIHGLYLLSKRSPLPWGTRRQRLGGDWKEGGGGKFVNGNRLQQIQVVSRA